MKASGGKDPFRAFRGPELSTPFGRFFGTPKARSDTGQGEREEATKEITKMVAKRFRVEKVRFDETGIYITIHMDPDSDGDMFERLRKDLKRKGLYPRLVQTGVEWVIVVYPMPPMKKRRITTNVVMFILTVITTVWAGGMIWHSRSEVPDMLGLEVLMSPHDLFWGGLTFALPLLLILGTHELGHYFTSRRYKVDASLPYFIPIPPQISPFGTFGALISMRENISNRRALVDIGVAGPIAGFLVAIPVTVIGFILTNHFPSAGAETVEGAMYIVFNSPLIFELIEGIIPVGGDTVLFPTAIAGWIGFLVTALNLLPVGQLDGGHIARGILGDSAKYLSWAMVGVMLFMGLFVFQGFLLFALLILLLGSRHPPPLDDRSPLKKRQYIVAGFAVVMMILSLHPVPIETIVGETRGIEVEASDSDIAVSHYLNRSFDVVVTNVGGQDEIVSFTLEGDGSPIPPTVEYNTFEWNETAFLPCWRDPFAAFEMDGWYILTMGPLEEREVSRGESSTWSFVVGCSPNKTWGENRTFDFVFHWAEEELSRVEIKLRRSRSSIHVDGRRHDLKDALRIEGGMYLHDPASNVSELYLRDPETDGKWELRIFPGDADGEWLVPGVGSYRTIEIPLEAVNGTQLAKINWAADPGKEELSAEFMLELWFLGNGDSEKLTFTIGFVDPYGSVNEKVIEIGR